MGIRALWIKRRALDIPHILSSPGGFGGRLVEGVGETCEIEGTMWGEVWCLSSPERVRLGVASLCALNINSEFSLPGNSVEREFVWASVSCVLTRSWRIDLDGVKFFFRTSCHFLALPINWP